MSSKKKAPTVAATNSMFKYFNVVKKEPSSSSASSSSTSSSSSSSSVPAATVASPTITPLKEAKSLFSSLTPAEKEKFSESRLNTEIFQPNVKKEAVERPAVVAPTPAPMAAVLAKKKRIIMDSDEESDDDARMSNAIGFPIVNFTSVPALPVSNEIFTQSMGDSSSQTKKNILRKASSSTKSNKKDREEESDYDAESSEDVESTEDEMDIDDDISDESDDDEYSKKKKKKKTKKQGRTSSKSTPPPSSSRAKPVLAPKSSVSSSFPFVNASSSSSSSGSGKVLDDSASEHSDAGGDVDGAGAPDHQLPKFLLPEYIKDKKKRRPTDPDYDPRTLHVPPEELNKFTPAQAQFWEIKSENMDVVLFFKMGKFYELFDMDAEVGIKELGLLHMKNQARLHVGFPEVAYSKYAEMLVHKGYKVGRVEQTQSPKQLEEENRNRKKGEKASKVVRREMCSILTKATMVDQEIIGSDDAAYLLSFTEEGIDGSEGKLLNIGVCFVDTSTGTFHVGEFEDDNMRTKFRTLLAQIRPAEVCFPRDHISPASMEVLKVMLSADVIRTPLTSGVEFLTAEKTIAELNCPGNYFILSKEEKEEKERKRAKKKRAAADRGEGNLENDEDGDGESDDQWPIVLEKCRDEMDGFSLMFSALGGCLHYLRRLLIDKELCSMKLFRLYDPLSTAVNEFLILDGQTLQNLEILTNSDGNAAGTLLAHLDHCSTPFGRRLLKEWVSKPLGNVTKINDRLNAVEDLMNNDGLVSELAQIMKKLPDLERLLSRITAFGMKKEEKAIMYEDVNKPKVAAFLKVLEGMDVLSTIPSVFAKHCDSLTSVRLQQISSTAKRNKNGTGMFPDIAPMVAQLYRAFDKRQAKTQGCFVPETGVLEDYDDVIADELQCEKDFQKALFDVQTYWKDKTIKFHHKNKEAYQLEISMETLKREKTPDSYLLQSSTKTHKRFWTPKIQTFVAKLEELKDKKEAVLKDVARQIFAKFGENASKWSLAVRCVAEIDVLLSFSKTSKYQGGHSTRPILVDITENGGKPLLELRDAIHPGVAASGIAGGIHSAGAGNADRSFIPNDTVLGVKENEGSRCCLVSGPNMGGKSTLLRQVCMNVIMAQLGVYVPASICRMTIVDRIFTRIGAHDLIMHGQSTFLVELMETASILQGATRQSLVILDELGRGTSTFDGTAIAYSVMKYLNSIDLDCLTLFSTHYHMLMEEFKDCKSISMYHMACKVNENAVKVESSNSSERTPDVTFLYKFLKGSCPKSYGMNVAKLAGLPPSLVSRAQHMSESFERRLEQAHNIGGSRPPPAKKLKLEASESAGKVKMLVDLLDRLLSSPSITAEEMKLLQALKAE